MRSLIVWMVVGAWLGVGVAGQSISSENADAGAKPEAEKVSVLGTLKCLGPQATLEPVADCDFSESEYVLESEDGKVWRFLREDPRTKIFSEPRVRNQPLHVIGRVVGGGLEIIDLHIVGPGGHLLPHYHCDVCNITAYAPGLCWCCQQPFEFRLRPADRETSLEERH